jgi:arylsulfatase A-like enzyme
LLVGYGDLGFTGHPTTNTPNIDRLAHNGRILTQWYSGCPVCSGSRAALMTGRQFTRVGTPGVFGPTVNVGKDILWRKLRSQMEAVECGEEREYESGGPLT